MLPQTLRRLLSTTTHHQPPVFVVALTGGPCGGKTSALTALSAKIPQISEYRVVQVPELSTLFHTAGSHYPAHSTMDDQLNWDFYKLKSQIALEDAFIHIAEKSNTPTIVLCDRGALDTKLFVSEAEWVNLHNALGYEDESNLLERYDAVVHLVTTAIGAEAFYTGAGGNAARRETLEEARSQDHGIRQAWMKHPNFLLISNRPEGSPFEDKLRRATEAVCSQVGIKTPSDVKRQWIVDLQDFEPGASAIRFQMETDFISSSNTDDVCVQRTSLVEGEEWPIWEENWKVGATYSLHQRSVQEEHASRAVRRSDRRLNKQEWKLLRGGSSNLSTTEDDMDISTDNGKTIRMKRTCFVHAEQFWKCDEIIGTQGQRAVFLLTLEGTKDMDSAVVPPFSTKYREVSLLSLRDLKDSGLLDSKSSKSSKFNLNDATTAKPAVTAATAAEPSMSVVTNTPIVNLRHPNHSIIMPELLKSNSCGQLLQLYQRNETNMGWYTAIQLINKITKHATKKNRPSHLDQSDKRWLSLVHVVLEAMNQNVMDSRARMGYANDDLTSVLKSLELLDMCGTELYQKLAYQIQQEEEEVDDPGESGHDFQGGSIGF